MPLGGGYLERAYRPRSSRCGSGDARGITWAEVAGDAARLEQWLAGARLPVRIVPGEPAVRAVGIGRRELRTLDHPG